MELINIPIAITDIYYRYKREVCEVIYKPVNGGVTIITNLETIASQLGRDINEIISYLKKKLGTQCIKGQFSGLHSKQIIEQHLERYICEYILCPRCGNPETIIGKKKKMSCKACGHTYIR